MSAWPPSDILANQVCSGCGERRVDGCKRGCPVVRARREARRAAEAERKARAAKARAEKHADPVDAMRDLIRVGPDERGE